MKKINAISVVWFCAVVVLCALLPACKTGHRYECKKIHVPTDTQAVPAPAPVGNVPTVTVWIHGTQFGPGSFAARLARVKQGLVRAGDIDNQYHLSSVAHALAHTDPENYPFEHLYFFGWSGALDFRQRKKAAYELHAQLKGLVQTYQTMYGIVPKIRIIAHSHGGNVALNLAHIHDKNSFIVDELILTACPVQVETSALIESSIFKEVFVIYSSIDLIQVADPQGMYPHDDKRPLFSKKRFDYAPHIMQVKIKVDGHTIMHTDFIRPRYVRLLPGIVRQMRAWRLEHGAEAYQTDEAYQLLSVYTDPALAPDHETAVNENH